MSDFITIITSRESFSSASAGALASAIAMLLTYPLDRVRTLAQIKDGTINTVGIIKEVLQNEGIAGLYQGVNTMMVVLGASNFVYFYFNSLLKALYVLICQKVKKEGANTMTPNTLSNLTNLFIASVSGVLNVLLTTPLWVVATRIASERRKMTTNGAASEVDENVAKKGLVGRMIHIAREEGVGELWSGLLPSLMLVSNPAIQFASYEKLKRSYSEMFNKKKRDMNSYEHFLLGALAKMVATVLTYPLQLSQTRMRANRQVIPDPKKTIIVEQPQPVKVEVDEDRERLDTLSDTESESTASVSSKCSASDDTKIVSPKKKVEKTLSFRETVKVMKIDASPAKVARGNRLIRRSTSTTDVLRDIYVNEGFKGWFRGMDAKLAQTCLTAAFMFAFYEQLFRKIRTAILNPTSGR